MANNYKIEVSIKIVECDNEVLGELEKRDNGQFELVIGGNQGRSIDECEQALLGTNAEALRDALSSHLTEVSKQAVEEQGGTVEESEVKQYQVDGEVGRFTFETHRVKEDGRVVYDTSTELFPVLTGKEWYRTQGFKEIAFVHGTVEDSYRKTSEWLNRVRHQAGATPSRTLRDNSEAEGKQVMKSLEEKAEAILKENGFSQAGQPGKETKIELPQEMVFLPSEQVEQALKETVPETKLEKEMVNNPVPYENPAQSTNISIDDVGVKRQKEERNKREETEQKRKYLHNTVSHIQHGQDTYLINGYGVVAVLRLIVAFLLHNDLLQYNLIFFFDGQKSLGKAIIRLFSWFKPIQLILDWYHLEKKCQQLLSLACKGRQFRNDLLDKLMPLLWHGCVGEAMALLQTLDKSTIKNKKVLDDLINYLEYHRATIPCYSIRKKLGLRNGSNPGEKANDLLVSTRQKHNGMSWSRLGSVTLASLTALVKNNEYKNWFSSQTIEFGFAS